MNNWEAIMQFRIAGVLLLGMLAFATSVTAQSTPPASAVNRTVIAATKLLTATEVPLHFRAVSVTLPPREKTTVSAANGILYQLSGSTEIAVGRREPLLLERARSLPLGGRRR